MSQVVRRPRRNRAVRWAPIEVDALLATVLLTYTDFEKPTASLYYQRIAFAHPELLKFTWTVMRDKMRNLKVQYRRTIEWRHSIGAAYHQVDEEPSIREHTLKLCPHFDTLHEIYGIKLEVEDLCEVRLNQEDETLRTTSFKPFIDESGGDAPENEEMSEVVVDPSTPQTSGTLFTIARERLSYLSRKLETDNEIEGKKIELDRQKFEWQQKREQNELELEGKKFELEEKKLIEEMRLKQHQVMEEIRLKEEEVKNKFALEKIRIEKQVVAMKLKLGMKKKENGGPKKENGGPKKENGEPKNQQ